ncbi:AraC family transcriptional regulator, partial [Rubrivivax sp. A210]|uniref:AraC family transcriptional regulator n=1 Tax=Rubrivivax sp. A210 TaxID=2772301 RepID=UPI0019185FC2
MSEALRIIHGEFGRVMLVRLDEPVVEHAHRTGELLFKIGGGDLCVSVGDTVHRLGDDEVMLLNPWESHAYGLPQGEPAAELLSLQVDPAWLRRLDRRYTGAMGRQFFAVAKGRVPALARAALAQIADTLAYELEPSAEALGALVQEIVFAMAMAYSKAVQATGSYDFSSLGGVACDARIRKVLSIMAASVGEPIQIEELARVIRVSRPHFFHLFKQETRLTPLVYSSVLRMESAIRQIAESGDMLVDISNRLGFESPGNFTRFFKLQQGFSPSQYRRNVTVLA